MASSVPDHSNSDPDDGVRATISLLRDLAAHAETTLCSVSAFLSAHTDPSSSGGAASSGGHPSPDPGFCCCPYDPRHRMPPESLFRHSLRCPAAPGGPLRDLDFLEELWYPGALKSECELREENPFVRPLPESGVDLCFSLEKELEDVDGSSFFYRDCPGVVTYPEPDVSARTFTLPGFLAVECANFVCSSRERENGVLGGEKISILPSDFWALKREVESWKDYPERYSYTAAWVASCMTEAGDCGAGKWIISTSPRFGVLIDAAMRDHIFLLLKLCVKAIRWEASGSIELPSGCAGAFDPRCLCFKCPCLFQALSWLASQLGVLYGEKNGKTFAISMIAESLLRVGSRLLLFPLHEYGSTEGTHGIRQEICGSKLDADVTDGGSKSVASEGIECQISSENLCTDQVFVSQVAAAVAALHERSILEDRVKLLRFPRLLSKYKLFDEHSHLSMRANEVRSKRSNYIPILENDGLLWQKPLNQGMSRTKTREELLAEERDYKRRRMSYRGKKVKRTTTQVIRDIIEEHMEVIQQSGGIGCNMKGSTDAETLIPGSSFQGNASSDVDMVKEKESEPSGISSRDSFVSKKPHYTEFDISAGVPENAYREDTYNTYHHLKKGTRECRYDHLKKDMRECRLINHKMQENSERSVDMGGHMDHEYGKSANYRSHRRSNDRCTHQREKDGKEVSGSKYAKQNSVAAYSFKDYTDSSSLSSSSMTKEEYSHVSERQNHKGRNRSSCRSGSVTKIKFEDRYDPYTTYEDVSADVSPRKNYSMTTDMDGYHDLRRHHHSNRKHEREKM